ncbi:MAG: hypothetical protein AAGB04_05390 [Pseudomonadota bacterium]
MYQTPSGKFPPELDLARLAAALNGICRTIRRIPHLKKVADALTAAVEELERVQQRNMDTIGDPIKAERAKNRLPN